MNEEELLRRRCIPPRLHYVSDAQSDLWRALAAAHSPAGGESVQAAYAELFARVGDDLAGTAQQLITLGAGSGAKERELLRALNAAGCSLQITAVDVSESLAVETADKLSGGESEAARAVVGDFLSLDVGINIDGADEVPRLFTAFGLSPNIRPGEFFSALARLLRPGDRALLSANLWPNAEEAAAEREVLAQYDNEETRRWLGRLFKEWGMPDDHCPDLEFSIGSIEGVAAVIANAEWPDPASWDCSEFTPAPAQVREWRRGEPIEVFYSLRYTIESFSAQVHSAGLSVQHSVASQCGREAVFMVQTQLDGKISP